MVVNDALKLSVLEKNMALALKYALTDLH